MFSSWTDSPDHSTTVPEVKVIERLRNSFVDANAIFGYFCGLFAAVS
jgi:hypothetical protein